jgi:hypothetical protein
VQPIVQPVSVDEGIVPPLRYIIHTYQYHLYVAKAMNDERY